MNFEAMARESARTLLASTGDAALYHGQSGDIRTLAQIDADVDYLGGEARMADRRHVCVLLVEDIAEPHAGDEVREKSGRTWVLREPLQQSDDWFHIWTVKPK